MSANVETICVDIGNSGLRCVRVPGSVRPIQSACSVTADELPWVGDVLRIDWPPRDNASAAALVDNAQLAQTTIGNALESWLQSGQQIGQRPVRHWLVSSVQRTTASHLEQCAQRLGADSYRLITHADLDLSIEVESPERVGVDRLLAAVAALEHVAARPLIVIQAGSAITVDWIEAPRRFCGGAIIPGVPMMLRLLSRAADLLPDVAADELLELPELPGRNTATAMAVGASGAVVGGVQHLIARYRAGRSVEVPVVLSGGDGPRLAPHLSGSIFTVDQLVLRGLAQCVAADR